MPEEQKKEIIFEYVTGPDYREFYVNGARGGIQSAYHLRMEFYVEKLRMPFTKEKLEVLPDGTQRRVPLDGEDKKVVEREFKVGIMMPFYAVKELFRWLSQRLPEIEAIEKEALANPPASTNPPEEAKRDDE